MTNFFGINVTKGQESSQMDGAAFVVKKVSPEQSEEIEDFQEQDEKCEKKSSLPLPLGMLKFLCEFGWIIILAGIIKSDSKLADIADKSPQFIWAGTACFIIWIILFIAGRVHKKNFESTDEFAEHVDNADVILDKVKKTLEIPENAESIDMLAERYIVKNGEPKHKDFGMSGYMNLNLFIFLKDSDLRLADIEHVWSIPLASLRSITLIKKRANFSEWHKPEAFNSAKYKSFKITTNDFGQFFVRYYKVNISDVHGEFCFIIPEYDGEMFMKLTHLKPEEI